MQLDPLDGLVAAGADAVYLGGAMFGARAYANNLSQEELLRALDYAHLHDKKIYLTVNTLMKQQELEDRLLPYLEPFYKAGLSAVIVQDFGAFEAIKEAFPGLHIHASTQMTVTGAAGAKLLKEAGASRVVTARELNLSEIKAIHDNCDIEIESFIHGALCYCYSGQCLLSSFQGGRSGNRGRCAQPCRLPYAVLDEKHREYKKDAYVLSLKDMCGIKDLRGLADAGVYSLKIEGRMKQIPYAAGVVSYYRKYIDLFLSGQETQVSEGDYQAVLALGNRCGFTDGYYHRHNGSDMVTFTKPNYEKTNEALQQKILRTYENGAAKIPVRGELVLHQGQAGDFRHGSYAGAKETTSGRRRKKSYGKDRRYPVCYGRFIHKDRKRGVSSKRSAQPVAQGGIGRTAKRDAETLPETGSSAEEGREKISGGM